MIKRYRYFWILAAAFAIGILAYALGVEKDDRPSEGKFTSAGRAPKIRPDYAGAVIPPNIAPLNFSVQEPGSRYCVKIHSKNGPHIEVSSASPEILIPVSPWSELLEANRGQEVCFEIFVKPANSAASTGKTDMSWTRFEPVVNTIAVEDIDGFLVYRRIDPAHSSWRKMGIYQRELRGFAESIVLDNGYYGGGCLNCHTFCNNRTDKMLLGIRSPRYGSSALLVDQGRASKIGSKFGYTSWHPSGRLAVYSINYVTQFFHTAGDEVRDVVDVDSLLAYYLLDSGRVKTNPVIADKKRLETYPAWSPDGRYLYFCSAPKQWEKNNTIPENYDQIKYDLVRVGYDIETDEWGELETIVSAEQTGLSSLLPRISPDGRWLIFCMCDYGCFPVYQSSSDLYIIDLEAPRKNGRYEYRRLSANSDKSESWHSFSSNSRWIAFSSKRNSGVFTRSYISYLDRQGRAHKPLLLPQKDPHYYDSCLWTYSVPELIAEPVTVTRERLGRVVRGPVDIAVDMPVTGATPKSSDRAEEPMYTERE
ncbi:MAG: PD40 domain-containing protein [Sedimentisphaerales bacterium]|nr:PD40 domain-containing protein [Sedimentisphaerales bacterium]